MAMIAHLLKSLRALASDHARLALKNAALRQQLIVLKRSIKRPKIQDSDRVFGILMRRMLKDWKAALYMVKPETVVRWHRQGFKYYWRWKSKGKPGRPPIDLKVIHLIKRMSRENPLWGSPHIEKELALLGHIVAKSTIEKCMVRQPKEPSQSWRSFLGNHMNVTAACDFFTVPTAAFKVVYVFIVLSHDRRQIIHMNVTRHPTAEWTAQQLVEAFHGDHDVPRFLIRDRDSIYGHVFRRKAKALGIEEVITARKSPWQNPYCERVVGTVQAARLRETEMRTEPPISLSLSDELREDVRLSPCGMSVRPREVSPEPELVSRATLNETRGSRCVRHDRIAFSG